MDFKNIPKEYNGVSLENLSSKQKRFCEEYVIDNNGFASAERAGYHKKYCRRTVWAGDEAGASAAFQCALRLW